jgi:hypothetical protein
MTPTNPPINAYRDQITRCARGLATARCEEVQAGLASGSSGAGVERYLQSCSGQRYRSLAQGTELLAGGFDDLHELRLEYIRDVPLAAYDPNSGDARRFLEWLKRTRDLTPEQQDYWTCQWAPHAIADEARRNRSGHLRFQELRSVAGLLAGELETNPGLRVVINPLRYWSQFLTTALLEGAGSPPIDVLFFALGTEISTAILEPPAPALLDELGSLGPCTLEQWLDRSEEADPQTLIAMGRNLAQMGLVAFL